MDGTSREPFAHYCSPTVLAERATLERLEMEICELWGHLNAATYRFLELLAEFDRRRGWAQHGVASCAQWLNWQCGIGAVAAREKVRVARALESLPKISDSFRRGVISYSKVRAMTRIANAENEEALLNVAEHGTAAHVEKLVRKYHWVEALEAARRVNGAYYSRYVHFAYDDDGSLIVRAKLPPEVGAMVKKAIEAAVDLIERDAQPNGSTDASRTQSNVSAGTSEEEPDTVRDERASRRADALRHLAEVFLDRRSEDAGGTADRYQLVVHVDQQLLASGKGPTGPQRCELEPDRAIAFETVRRLGCDCSLVGIVDDGEGEPLSVGRKTRSIPPALQRALKARDGGCRFPGCHRTRFTEGHHVKHWAEGGETKLSNLVTLCWFHHRLVHEGGFGLTTTDDAVLVFTRPDGTRVEANGRLGVSFRGNISTWPSDDWDVHRAERHEAAALFVLNRARGLTIDAKTSRCRWLGEKMDYGMAIEHLIAVRDRQRARGGAQEVSHGSLSIRAQSASCSART